MHHFLYTTLLTYKTFLNQTRQRSKSFAGHRSFQFQILKMQKHGLQYHIEINELAAPEWLDELIATTYTRQNQYIGNAMSHYDAEYQSCQCLKS